MTTTNKIAIEALKSAKGFIGSPQLHSHVARVAALAQIDVALAALAPEVQDAEPDANVTPERLTIGDAFKAVGGWFNGGDLGYPSFGSADALRVYTIKMQRDAVLADRARQSAAIPIDMVLHCPSCNLQHIDGSEFGHRADLAGTLDVTWSNPPHRSHLCHGCGHIWRPADVATNGVKAVQTKGPSDSPIAKRAAIQPAGEAGEPLLWAALDLNGRIVYQHASRENVEMNRRYIKTPTSVVGLVVQCATPAAPNVTSTPDAAVQGSVDIPTWQKRCTDGKHNFASFNEARDAEIADLRAALAQRAAVAEAQGFGQKVTALVAEIRKAKSLAWRDSQVEALLGLIDPQPDAPTASTPPAPAEKTACRHGTSFRYRCDECDEEDFPAPAENGGADCHPSCGHIGAECDYPTCKSEAEQQAISAQVHAEIYGAPAEKDGSGDDGISPIYAWLERSAKDSSHEVSHAARTMMAYWQGAEFPAASPLMQVAPSVPAYWLEAEESARNADPRDILGKHSMLYSTQLSKSKPTGNNPCWPMYFHPAPVPPAVAPEPLIDKPLTIIANAYQVGAKHGADERILDVLANPEAATAEQVEAMLPYVVEAPEQSVREALLEAAQLAKDYGPNRPIMTGTPTERIRGRWEGEQAASSGIESAIRALIQKA